MIAKQELMRLRGEWQLDVSVIEKDYVLGWVLAAIAAEPSSYVRSLLPSVHTPA